MNTERVARYVTNIAAFNQIPGYSLAYWLSPNALNLFLNKKLSDFGTTRLGMTTGENARFVRLWHEVDENVECFDARSQDDLDEKKGKYWVPYNKGGGYRKWYGNNDCVVFWNDHGSAIKNFADEQTGRIRSTVPNTEYYFLPCASWSKISTGRIAFRYKECCIFDVAGACLFTKKELLLYLMALLNSKVVMIFLEAMSPTLNFEGGQISSISIVYEKTEVESIIKMAKESIDESRTDWDSFETSWDFKKHPLI